MRNNNYTRPPRKGVIVFASFVFAALFVIAFIISYEQRTDLAHSVHLSPTSANYGTVSTIRSSSLAVPMHSTAPLLSSGTIHAYAYSGHATMPSTGSSFGFRIHTLSSATIHSYGSGGGGGGGAVSGGSSSSPSSPTIRYSGASVSTPSLAMTSTSRTNRIISSSEVLATETGNDSHRPGQIKRVHSDGFGGYEGDYNGEYYEGQWWNSALEEWVGVPFNGAKKIDGGLTYEYRDGEWVLVGNQADPTNVPVGDAPWFWMLLLLAAYIILKRSHTRKCCWIFKPIRRFF